VTRCGWLRTSVGRFSATDLASILWNSVSAIMFPDKSSSSNFGKIATQTVFNFNQYLITREQNPVF
jgi:hypothetical protein